LKDWKLQGFLKDVILMPIIAEGIEAWSNDYFRGILRHWMLIHERALEKDIVQLYNHYLHYFTLCVCNSTRQQL